MGFSLKDLDNSRHDIPLGLMTSLEFWKFIDGVITQYNNTKVDVIYDGRLSYEIMGNITAVIYDYLKSEYPDILSYIQHDNEGNDKILGCLIFAMINGYSLELS